MKQYGTTITGFVGSSRNGVDGGEPPPPDPAIATLPVGGLHDADGEFRDEDCRMFDVIAGDAEGDDVAPVTPVVPAGIGPIACPLRTWRVLQ
jgi:hypothetical protein